MKKMDDRAKKLLLLFAGIIVFIIIICIIAFVIGKTSNSSLDYVEIEEKLVEAAQNYYSKNSGELPLNEEERNVEVSVSTLVSSGYLNELSSYQKDESVICDGKVKVIKSGDYYDYSPYLDCGDKYRTIYLYEKLLDGVVTNDDGLYKTTQYSKNKGNVTRYIFRGEYPNNYVSIDGVLWHIVKINEDNTITLIKAKVDRNNYDTVVWDDRYNIKTDSYDGINNFEESRIRRTLDTYYENIYTEYLKKKMVNVTNCVGARRKTDNKNNGSIECSKLSENSFVSLLPTYDFINASLDKNCKTINDKSCSNYNYLTKFSGSWWMLTVSADVDTKAYVANKSARADNFTDDYYARTVISLNENTIYTTGDGTSTNPYIIK